MHLISRPLDLDGVHKQRCGTPKKYTETGVECTRAWPLWHASHIAMGQAKGSFWKHCGCAIVQGDIGSGRGFSNAATVGTKSGE